MTSGAQQQTGQCLCTSLISHRVNTQVCANKARDVLPPALLAGAATDDADRPLTHRETKQLMLPLIRLRQACCHPQASLVPTHLHCFTPTVLCDGEPPMQAVSLA